MLPFVIIDSKSKQRPNTTVLTFEGNDFPEQFKCPVCFEIPEKEVYQCKNGHTICDECYANVQNCPQCRCPLVENGTPIRNRALESILESMQLNCPFRTNGCSETILRKAISSHNVTCNFNGKCIKFCQMLGLKNCSFDVNSLNVAPALEHFSAVHKTHFFEQSGHITVKLECFTRMIKFFQSTHGKDKTGSPLQKAKDGLWTPMILKLDSGKHVVLLVLFNGTDMTIAIVSFQIEDGETSSLKPIKLCVKSVKPNVPCLKWTTGTIPILQSEEFLKSPPCRIPVDLIQRNYLMSGDLNVYCYFGTPSHDMVHQLMPRNTIVLNTMETREEKKAL